MELWQHAGIHAKLTIAMGIVPLIMAIIYVINPTERNLALMRPISLAGLFAGLSGVTLGFVNVLRQLGMVESLSRVPHGPIATGASESFVPMFVSFSCLSVAWILVAVGMSRSRAEA